MAMIVVDIATIAGESEISGYVGKVEGIGISESVVSSSASADGKRAAEVEVIRYKDTASPKLAQACAAGSSLGTVGIQLLEDVNGEVKTVMDYSLKATYVKSISYETLDQANLSYQSGGLANAPQGLALSGGFGGREIERVVFNVSEVNWTHTGYDKDGTNLGNTQRGYNLQAGQVASG